jgi:TRAP-type C4-dicarboxylate transport system permease small subunit
LKLEEETLNNIKKPLDAIERLFTFLAMISVFLMACLTAADAMGRYFLNQPISGAFEITENYLMIFAVYFAFAYAYKNGANVRLTFVVSRLPSRATLVVNYFVQIFSILYIVFLFISATRINLGRLNKVVELTQTLSIPVWPAYFIMSLGLVFVSLFVILDFWQVKRGKSGLFKESSEETSTM